MNVVQSTGTAYLSIVLLAILLLLSPNHAHAQTNPAAVRPRVSSEVPDISPAELFNLRVMAGSTILWFWVVGICVGSFMNVVAHRWPRGLSLSYPPSRCPVCETPIERRDNVPLLGWLRLGGRCRSCRSRISFRYPLVEAIAGLLCVGLLCIELLSGGSNLPIRPANSYVGVVWILWYTKWDLVAIYTFHLGLVLSLLMLAEIHRDGFALAWRPARRSIATCAALFAIALLALLPDLHLVPLGHWPVRLLALPEWLTQLPFEWRTAWLWKPGLNYRGPVTALVGGAAGGLLGLWLLRPAAQLLGGSDADARSWWITLAVIGVFLGWQAVAGIALIGLAVLVLRALLHQVRLTLPLTSPDLALGSAAVFICFWRRFEGLLFLKPVDTTLGAVDLWWWGVAG